MFRSVLIANRGEIACRIIRGARKLGIASIAVYSDADAHSEHVRTADHAVRIGPPPAPDSYLNAAAIVAAAVGSGAECVHPGYGFLSENAEFADMCASAGLAFIGPSSAAMRAMGLKDAAKALMEKAGVPVVPGYHGPGQDEAELTIAAGNIGFPLMIKAVAGGGGKGMRRVDAPSDFSAALASVRREARLAFGNDHVLLEKYIANPRHIEVQIFGDRNGNIVHLNERDCSLQRRHQKVIEEAPAPGMTPQLRAAMGAAAIGAARAVDYVGAGTVEFIVDGADDPQGGFWFMEMNTRLQVEHPVTEAITGVDLVEWQFRIAAGENLPLGQHDIGIQGHAVEGRLYAEDPANGFLPSPGRLIGLQWPSLPGVRIDFGVREGDDITRFYDPMIAKIIAHGATRMEALDRLAGALNVMLVAGPQTNQAFLKALCEAPEFRQGRFDTGFIDRNLEELGAAPQALDEYSVALAVAHRMRSSFCRRPDRRNADGTQAAGSLWDAVDSFQLGGARTLTIPLHAGGRNGLASVEIGALAAGQTLPSFIVRFGAARADGVIKRAANEWIMEDGDTCFVLRAGVQTVVQFAAEARRAAPDDPGSGPAHIVSPMHGKLVALYVGVGETVQKNQRVATVEAMKMEHTLLAPATGRVQEIAAQPGAQVAQGAVLIVIEPEGGPGHGA